MLLTIHNLPLTTRYPDVKSLLHEKCGLTDIIVDNLVNEGKSKKVTVGLSNEDDGAFVVRKLNGLFINGQQLYIEHKRRNTTVHEQPYRPSSTFMQEAHGFEQTHINNRMETAMAPNAPSWNQSVTAPYMPYMPAEQNVAYSGYGGVPQTPHYMEPRPVPAENERGYSGLQGDNYIPTVASSGPVHQVSGPVHQAPGDWGRNGREQPSETFSHYDRKRRHSPERPAAPRLSRKDRHDAARAEPPRQWSEQGPSNQGPRPPFRQPEQFPRNQHQSVDDRYEPREPSPDYRHTDPQWESKRWDEPKLNPRSEREREWGNNNHKDWETQPIRVWENPPEQQWQEQPRRWDNEPKPQWKDNYSSMPEENNRPQWYEGLEPGPSHGNNVQEFHPQDQGQYRESRSRKSRFDDRSSVPIWDREPSNRSVSRPTASSNRQGRPAEEMQRRDRPRSKNGRQEREWRDDRPKQGPKNYPESKRQRPAPELNRRVAPKAIARPTLSRQERDEKNKTFRPFGQEEKNYPPRKPENKLLSLRALINKDSANRAVAASIIAKTVIGLPEKCSPDAVSKSVDRLTFRVLKKCIKSRIDVELGEEMSMDTTDAVKKYRAKYPINQDKTFLKQIREKAEIEREEMHAKYLLKKAGLEERGTLESGNNLPGSSTEIKTEEETDTKYVKIDANTIKIELPEEPLPYSDSNVYGLLTPKPESRKRKGSGCNANKTVKMPPNTASNEPQSGEAKELMDTNIIARQSVAREVTKLMLGMPNRLVKRDGNAPKRGLEVYTYKQIQDVVLSRINSISGSKMYDLSDTDFIYICQLYSAAFQLEDPALLEQIRERCAKEYVPPKLDFNYERVANPDGTTSGPSEVNAKDKRQFRRRNKCLHLNLFTITGQRVKTEVEIKKEEDETENNSQKEDILNQARLEVENETKEHKETMDSDTKGTETNKPSLVPLVPPNMPKGKPGKPLTDKQVIRQMKLQRKLEYNQDNLYSLDEVSDKVLGDELAELEKLITEECQPDDQHDEDICKRITSVSLNEFHKTIRLYISKRILNIPTGLLIRVFAQGKLPRKTAIKEYMNKYRIESMSFKKNVKGTMFIISLSRFQDFDHLCRIENDVIDGIPVTFKAMNLVGPPTKLNKNQVKKIRERLIQGQIDPKINLDNLVEFEDTTDYGAVGAADEEDFEDFEEKEDIQEKQEVEDFTEDIPVTGKFEGEDIATDTADITEDFAGDINIGNINEEDLEDF